MNTLIDVYSQYGVIASIRSLSDLITTFGFGYAIIELTDGRYAEVAIINDKINKRYCIVPDVPSFRNDSRLPFLNYNAFPRLYQHSPPSNPPPSMSYELQNPPESESSLNIINKLCDSHLQEIFSYLLLPDLCSVSDVCTNFRKNAKIIYEIQFEYKTPEIDDVVHFESLARHFGTLIRSLSFNCWLFPDIFTKTRKNAVLSILVKYFSVPDCRLERLSLTKMDIDARWHPLLAPIFSKLQYLRLDQSRISELLCCCSELVTLDLCYDVGQFIANGLQTKRTLANLKRLTLWETKEWRDILFRQLDFGEKMHVLNIQDSEMDQDCQTICDIFAKFPHLEDVCLAPQIDLNRWPKERYEIVNIFKRMVKLSTLTLNGKYLIRFNTPLQTYSGPSGFLNLLAEANVPLQRLTLCHDVNYLELNSISRFKTMQFLAINGMVLAPMPLMTMIKKLHQLKELRLLGEKNPVYWHKEDIKEIVQHGKQLSLLYFGNWQEELIIFENDYDEIVHSIVQAQLCMHREPRSKLTITIRSNKDMTLAVPADKIAKSYELLQIKMLPQSAFE